MNSDTHGLRSGLLWSALALGAAAAGIALVVNTTIIGLRPLQKLAVDWTPAQYTASELVVLALSAVSGAALAVFVQNATFKPLTISERSRKWASVVGWANIAFLVFAVALTISHAPLFRALIKESGAVSIAQAVLIFLALCLFVRLTLTRGPHTGFSVYGIPMRVVTGAITLVLFLLLMEEISWGQHYIGWQTPEAFSANIQNETNLHNFYTHRFELAYYSGAAFVFCVLPIWASSTHSRLITGAKDMIPPPIFGFVALPLTAFLYESWSIVPLQVLFFLGLALAWFAARRMNGSAKLLAVSIFVAMLACQIIYLITGHLLVAGHELSEMRELVIAWMIFAYAVWLTWRLRMPSTADSQPQEQ